MKWTLAEFERLGELGFFLEDEHIELIGGELVPMSPKGARHEGLRSAVLNWFARRLPPNMAFHSEPGWRPDAESYLEPDMIIGPANSSPTAIPASEILLVVEVSVSSLTKDLGTKAAIYARLGVGEFWVIDAKSLTLHAHRDPSASGYASVRRYTKDSSLSPQAIPALTFRISDLTIPAGARPLRSPRPPRRSHRRSR